MYKKHLFWLVLTLIMGASYANAQVNLSGVYYYIEAGKELTNNTSVRMFYYDGETIYTTTSPASRVSARLYKDSNYWVEYLTSKKVQKYTYESSLSTSKNEVYSKKRTGTPIYDPTCLWSVPDIIYPIVGKDYYAISSDLDTVIFWYELNSSKGNVNGKKYYMRVPESDLDKDPHDFLK